MAQVKRGRPRATSGGKLALFEVLQNARPDEGAEEVAQPRLPAAPVPPPRIVTHQRSGGVTAGGLLLGVLCLGSVAGAAMFLGQYLSRQSTPQVAASDARPEVLDVGRSRQAGNAANDQSLARPSQQTQVQVAQPPTRAVVPDGFRRVNGLNYIVVQSYAPSEMDRAVATRDALLAAGLGATIETGITGWGKNLCVIGTEGFERVRNNPQHDEYLRRIMAVSVQTRGNRKIKSFAPTGFQWSQG